MSVVAASRSVAGGGARLGTLLRREWALVTAAVVWLFFVANFTLLYTIGGDAPHQYFWVQRLYGDRARADGYFFGLGLLEAPFYGVGKLLDHAGVHTLGGIGIENALVALGTGFFFVIPAAVILVVLLRALRLPGAAPALLAATFGTSLLFWAVFSPGKNHPADTALFTLVVYLTFLFFRRSEPARWLPWALGAVLGFSITVRYFAGAEAVMLALVLSFLRRRRDAAVVLLSTAAVTGLLFLVPWGLDTPVFSGALTVSTQTGFYPLNPLRMLFTEHRGLFVWSPVTVLAAIGLVIVFRNRPEHRRFFVASYAMGLGIVLSYVFVSYWDGAWSFGQRYYTPLYPLVVIGLAGLWEASRGALRVAVGAAMAVGALWSIYLCLNLALIGWGGVYRGVTFSDGAGGVAQLPRRTHESTGAYLWSIYNRSRLVKPVVPWPFATR
ncbi:MAG TPA: hypothetical protein VH416_09525 [Gaiellaceae bacterium]